MRIFPIIADAYILSDSSITSKKNIPTIIDETGYDRETICKYIGMTDFNTPEPKVKDPENICPKLDSYKPLIVDWLTGDRKAPRKQRHTAKRVFHRLQL